MRSNSQWQKNQSVKKQPASRKCRWREFGIYERTKKLFDMFVDSAKRVVTITIGSAGANGMYVARGSIDWYVNYNPRIWDIAPNVLLFSEAGYKVTNIKGKPWKFGDQGIIAAEKTLHKKLIGFVKKSMR
ncbi:MAG: inositol monophosphatase family protein [Patescibacteria group bacterium]|nr:inositol monophosphatase family protein [Patescibacteria group bacterium]